MTIPEKNIRDSGDQIPPPRSLQSVKEALVNTALVALALSGLVALPLSLLRVRDLGWQDALALQSGLYFVLVIVTLLRRRLSYPIWAGAILVLGFVMGLAGLLSWGLISGGEMFFFATVMLAAIFLGQRVGLAAVAVCMTAIAVTGTLVHLGRIPLDFDQEAYARAISSWITETSGFVFFTVIAIISLGRLHRFLAESNHILGEQARELGRANLRLQEEIREKEKIQEELKSSEEQYRLVVENASDAIGIVADGRVRYLNPCGLDLLGYTREELRDLSFLELLHESDRDLARERNRLRQEGQLDNQMFEYRVRKKDGQVLVVQLNGVGIQWKGSHGALIMARDVTRMKAMEAQIHRAQRMEAVGTLAGGLAHDFNNLLMGIQGHASLMGLNMHEDCPIRENIRSVEEFVAEAARLTGQLLGFARGGKYEVRPADLNGLVEKSSDMFVRTRREIMVERELAASWAGEVDRSQMEQVLLNLYINAWQAMPGGGTLRLSTADVRLSEAEAREEGISPGRYVGITVADTGQGMEETILDRIFDPFFTTKERGRGTGLGLASAHGIVKNHGGAVTVKSRPGQGTVFRILVPASLEPVREEPRGPRLITRSSASVLFVDDEAVARDTGRAMLEALGCRVTCAQSGPEALEILAKPDAGFDLVILDMIMPGMSGRDALPQVREFAPEARVLLSSGYAVEDQVETRGKEGFDGFLKKPYTLEFLSEKIQVLLPRPDLE
ncbi:MAG: PAS domain S-box protein [Proteobacteria bacterium]|nr:PAS domain S-box protein [Pseudomonadota bacterium]